MIVEKILETKQRNIKQWPVRSNRASELGHECLRYLVLNRTRWQEKTLHTVDLELVFGMGRAVERVMEEDLREAGFTIVEQQRPFAWDKYNITGRVDSKLGVTEELILSARDDDSCPLEIRELLLTRLRTNGHAMEVVPAEVKSSAPHPFESIHSIQDMLNHKYGYMRRYPAQLTLYMLMDNKDVGVFLFKEKVKGKPKELWITLDYEYAESLVKKAELINKHVAEGTLPDPMEYREDTCADCGYQHICMPERIGKEVEVTDDTELIDLVNRYMELKPYAKDFEFIDKRINEMVKGREKILVGDYFIQGKWQSRTMYNIPEEVRAPYKEMSQYWKKEIMPIKGGNDGKEG